MRLLPLALALLLPQLAAAQIGLPSVRLPQLPSVTANLPQSGVPTDGLTSGTLSQLRRLEVRDLVRRHRDVIDVDPRGEPIVRGEVLALVPAGTEPGAAAGLEVARELRLEALGLHLVVLRTSADTKGALARVQGLDPAGVYAFNHIYLQSGRSAADTGVAPSGTPATVAERGAVGLVDGGVDAGHEVFAGVDLRQHGCAGAAPPSAHGTAVASLLVGRAAALQGADPGAPLYVADVFCGRPTGGAVSEIVAAFEWLARERVAVVNVSLVGPPNALLERVVESLLAHGHVVVAAVGNDGPAAPPLYPAAWPGVVGVTAVDARGRVLAEAGRGSQVEFAAPGADLAAARPGGGYQLVRGTSYAAPLVAGLLAAHLAAPDRAAAEAAVAALAQLARHPGGSGRDALYGYGVVGAALRPSLP
jgi:hypothetical protein